VETAIRQEFSVSNFPYRQIAEELIEFLVLTDSVVALRLFCVRPMATLVMLHGQSSATQVWKKCDPGLKSSLRRPILDSLFVFQKRESRITLLRSVGKCQREEA
jgi:hypothetical protein